MADKKQKQSNPSQKASISSSTSKSSKSKAKEYRDQLKDFSVRMKDQSEQDSLTKILSQLGNAEPSHHKTKHNRHKSYKMPSSPAPEMFHDDIGEDNVLDLLSGPNNSKAILQFYKKRGGSTSRIPKVLDEIPNVIDSSLAFNHAKSKIMKKKATMIIAENLKAILVGYWRVLVLKTLRVETMTANNRETSISSMKSKMTSSQKLEYTENEESFGRIDIKDLRDTLSAQDFKNISQIKHISSHQSSFGVDQESPRDFIGRAASQQRSMTEPPVKSKKNNKDRSRNIDIGVFATEYSNTSTPYIDLENQFQKNTAQEDLTSINTPGFFGNMNEDCYGVRSASLSPPRRHCDDLKEEDVDNIPVYQTLGSPIEQSKQKTGHIGHQISKSFIKDIKGAGAGVKTIENSTNLNTQYQDSDRIETIHPLLSQSQSHELKFSNTSSPKSLMKPIFLEKKVHEPECPPSPIKGTPEYDGKFFNKEITIGTISEESFRPKPQTATKKIKTNIKKKVKKTGSASPVKLGSPDLKAVQKTKTKTLTDQRSTNKGGVNRKVENRTSSPTTTSNIKLSSTAASHTADELKPQKTTSHSKQAVPEATTVFRLLQALQKIDRVRFAFSQLKGSMSHSTYLRSRESSKMLNGHSHHNSPDISNVKRSYVVIRDNEADQALLQRSQHRMMSLLSLEKVCAQLTRKIYRVSFEKIKVVDSKKKIKMPLKDDFEEEKTGRSILSVDEHERPLSREHNSSPKTFAGFMNLKLSQQEDRKNTLNTEGERFSTKASDEHRKIGNKNVDTVRKGALDRVTPNKLRITQVAENDDMGRSSPSQIETVTSRQIVERDRKEFSSKKEIETNLQIQLETEPSPKEKNNTRENSRTRSHNISSREVHDVVNIEDRIERNLETKLGTRIEQSVDDKIKRTLEQELLVILSRGLESLRSNPEMTPFENMRMSMYDSEFSPSRDRVLYKSVERSPVKPVLTRNFYSPVASSRQTGFNFVNSDRASSKPSDDRFFTEPQQRGSQDSSGFKEYAHMYRSSHNPSFNSGSPIRPNSTVYDNTEVFSSHCRKSSDVIYFSPQRYDITSRPFEEVEKRPVFLSPQCRSPLHIDNLYAEDNQFFSKRSSLYEDILSKDKKRGSNTSSNKTRNEISRSIRFFCVLDRLTKRKRTEHLWEGFKLLHRNTQSIHTDRKLLSDRVNHFSEVSRSNALETITLSYTTIQQDRPTPEGMKLSLAKSVDEAKNLYQFQLDSASRKLSEFHAEAQGVKSSGVNHDDERRKTSRRNQSFDENMSQSFLQKSGIKTKRNTLNYLVFSKKIEKFYKSRIRLAFTKLCCKQNQIEIKNKRVILQRFMQRCTSRVKKLYLEHLKAHTAKTSETNHVIGKLFSLLHQRQLRRTSEAFHSMTNFGLIKNKVSLNLALMFIKFSDMRKKQLQSVFGLLKQSFGQTVSRAQKKKLALKNLLKDDKLRVDFTLRETLLKWNTAAIKLSACMEIETARNEYEQVNEKNALRRLRNLFISKKQHNKALAFFKIKHHTRNLRGAANMFRMLDKKTWNKKRCGYEAISNFSNSSSITKRSDKTVKLKRFVEVMNRQLQNNFMKLLIHSTNAQKKLHPVKLKMKKGLLHLCVIADDLRHKSLLHGLKMIELYNIYKRNQKSLYLNLSLKLLLLFEDKEMMHKQEFFSTVYEKYEKDILRKKLLEKLLRRSHQRNLGAIFNKFRTEITNVKLNHSIVNLAIKDIILAIEKLSRLQRSKKALFFRKLNMFNFEKRQATKSTLSMNYILERQNTLKDNIAQPRVSSLIFPGIQVLRGIGSIESIDLDAKKYTDEEKIAKCKNVSNMIGQKNKEHLKQAFLALKATMRMSKLVGNLEKSGLDVFKTAIYKRVFLAFAQVKYAVEKKVQRIQNHRLNATLMLANKLAIIAGRAKKTHFKSWRATSKISGTYFQNKLAIMAQLKLKKIFDEWRVVIENEEDHSPKIQKGANKLNKLMEKKTKSVMKTFMLRLKKFKLKSQKIPTLAQSMVFAKSPQSADQKSFVLKTMMDTDKTPTESQKSSSNRPSFNQLSFDQSPVSSTRKSNRPAIPNVSGLNFSRQISMVVGTEKTDKKAILTPSQASSVASQASSKVASPNPIAKMLRGTKK